MNIWLETVPENDSRYLRCDNQHCRRLEEYVKWDAFTTIQYGRPVIRAGTIIAVMESKIGGGTTTLRFCRDCIDLVFADVKKVMDSKLWSFQ